VKSWLSLKSCLLVFLAFLFWLVAGFPGLAFFISSLVFVFLVRYLWHRLFWKVSRRLTLSYLIMATTAFLMGITILLVVIYAVAGLILHYEVDSRLRMTYEEMLFWHQQLKRFPDPAMLLGFTSRYPGANARVLSDDGLLLAGSPKPMGSLVETAIELEGSTWFLIVNDPGLIRLEVPLDDVLNTGSTYLRGMNWDIFIGSQLEEGNITSQMKTGPFRPRIQPGKSWLDRLIFRSLFLDLTSAISTPAEKLPRGHSASPTSPPWASHESDLGRPIPMVVLSISPRDLYLSLAPQAPGSPRLILQVLLFLTGFIVLMGSITLVFAAVTVVRITQSIRRLSAGGERFSSGEFTYRIPIRPRRDELNLLALQFNRMAESIETFLQEEMVKNQMLKEIEIASTIQRSLLPEKLNLNPFESTVHFEPCERVGGDYYDAFSLKNHHLFTIGDASGHGVPAAILMSMVKSVMSTLVDEGRDPDIILKRIHEFLAGTVQGEQFITLQMVAIHQGHLHLFNAGHPPPILLSNGSPRLVELPSMPVGLLDGPRGESIRVDFRKGDILFFYTDGLYEAVDQDDEIFGFDRLLDVLGRSPRHPGLIITNVLHALDAFREGVPLGDDLTMVALRAP